LFGGAETVLETPHKNDSSDNFLIICVIFVRRSQEKPRFDGSGSSVKKQLPKLLFGLTLPSPQAISVVPINI